MYSPRIREERIPGLYRLARSRGIPMTALVDEVLGALLAQPAVQEEIAAMTIPAKPGHGRRLRPTRARGWNQAAKNTPGQS